MKEISTQTCRRYGHPEVRLEYDPSVALEDDAGWLASHLDGEVSRGVRFGTGETIQVGWLIDRFEQCSDGTLRLFEPDLLSLPVQYKASGTATLSHLRIQKAVCESLRLQDEMLFPSMHQSAVICSRLEGSSDIIMDRLSPSVADSGWFIGCVGEHDHHSSGELARVSLYEMVARFTPAPMPFLSLPAGIALLLEGGSVRFLRGGERLKIVEGSFLARATAPLGAWRHGP